MMKSMLEFFNFGKNITYKYLEFFINPNMPISLQEDNLCEDMIQMSYSNNYTLDVGWYPAHNISGRFVIRVIYQYDWENPKLIYECRDVAAVESYLDKCVKYITQFQ